MAAPAGGAGCAVIIVDKALAVRAAAGNPVRVGMVGAGFMGRGIARSIIRSFPGIRLVAVANRTASTALRAYTEVGVDAQDVATVATSAELEDAIAAGRYAITDDPQCLTDAPSIEAIIEVTGTIEYAATVVERAIEHGKHVILMNAELDGTIGPIIKVHADRAGVIVTACEGDQPGVEANLFRFVTGLGLQPMVCGNIKGLHDRTRNPTTQRGWADRWGMGVEMVTSFADGTKISFEQAIVANGTGMRVARRGMYGHNVEGHVDDLTGLYDLDEVRGLGGIVDYVVGAQPAPGVFIYATTDDERERHYLNLYKRGEGPLYSFYTPYHLCHFEVPTSAARAVLFGDSVLAPLGPPMVDVVAAAKIDLSAGQALDGIGEYMTYGLCENAETTLAERLLPMGLAGGSRLIRDVPRDQVLTYDDVEIPAGRLADRLRREQTQQFFGVGSAGLSRG